MGAEAKPHSGGCRERTIHAVMNDDVGQQRLHAADQRVPPAGGQQAVATRVEAARRAIECWKMKEFYPKKMAINHGNTELCMIKTFPAVA